MKKSKARARFEAFAAHVAQVRSLDYSYCLAWASGRNISTVTAATKVTDPAWVGELAKSWAKENPAR